MKNLCEVRCGKSVGRLRPTIDHNIAARIIFWVGLAHVVNELLTGPLRRASYLFQYVRWTIS